MCEGINGILFGLMPGSEHATAADIITGYRMLIAHAHLHDLPIVGYTLPPIDSSPVFTPEFEDPRQQVNHWIRDSGELDAVADLDAALRDPVDPASVPPNSSPAPTSTRTTPASRRSPRSSTWPCSGNGASRFR